MNNKFSLRIDVALKHGWTIRNYDATYTFLGRVGRNGRVYGLAVTRSTGRVQRAG